MKMNIQTFACLAAILLGASCSKNDDDALPAPVASSGATMTLNGGEGGSAAVNTVFVDFSTDAQDSVKRSSWNLGFYSGSDFRVIQNNTTGASAIALNKTDLNSVTTADVTLSDLSINLGTAGAFGNIDNPVDFSLTKTIIPAISATDASNLVYIINPTGGSWSTTMSLDSLWKIRVLRNGTTGYTLQYAKLSATTYSTLNITKNSDYNYTFVNFHTGGTATVQPAKANWDIEWTYSLYYGGNSTETYYPYSFSDIVFINTLGGTTAAQKVYSNVSDRDSAFKYFNKDSITKTTFSSSYDVIGSKWRATTGTVGVLKDRFYVVKDAAGNYYALQFLNFIAADGGVRGKPTIEYKLID